MFRALPKNCTNDASKMNKKAQSVTALRPEVDINFL